MTSARERIAEYYEDRRNDGSLEFLDNLGGLDSPAVTAFMWDLYRRDQVSGNGRCHFRCEGRVARFQTLCETCITTRIEWRPRPPAPGEDKCEVVYALVDDDRKTLYVGVTCNPVTRFTKHLQDKQGVTRMVILAAFACRTDAEAYESHRIHAEQPPLNKRGTGKEWCPCGRCPASKA